MLKKTKWDKGSKIIHALFGKLLLTTMTTIFFLVDKFVSALKMISEEETKLKLKKELNRIESKNKKKEVPRVLCEYQKILFQSYE